MKAFITGSGFYDFPDFRAVTVSNRFGKVTYLSGQVNGSDALLLPRHGAGHAQLPHHINHRANLLALKEAGAEAVISCSVCGVVNPDWEIGVPLIADDLLFTENRLGDGTACSLFDREGAPERGHLLAGSLFHQGLSEAIKSVWESAGTAPRTGLYAHALGPRFNTKAEIRQFRRAGVDFLSQTCGPEAVLANELELPYALACFGVDFANGVRPKPTSIETLQANMARAKAAFTQLITGLGGTPLDLRFENFVYRFE